MIVLRWIVMLWIGVVKHFWKLAALLAVILGLLFGLIYMLQDYLIYLAILVGMLAAARTVVWFRMRRW